MATTLEFENLPAYARWVVTTVDYIELALEVRGSWCYANQGNRYIIPEHLAYTYHGHVLPESVVYSLLTFEVFSPEAELLLAMVPPPPVDPYLDS